MTAGTADRMTRLLALVPYLTARPDGVSLAEAARDFGVPERQQPGHPVGGASGHDVSPAIAARRVSRPMTASRMSAGASTTTSEP